MVYGGQYMSHDIVSSRDLDYYLKVYKIFQQMRIDRNESFVPVLTILKTKGYCFVQLFVPVFLLIVTVSRVVYLASGYKKNYEDFVHNVIANDKNMKNKLGHISNR